MFEFRGLVARRSTQKTAIQNENSVSSASKNHMILKNATPRSTTKKALGDIKNKIEQIPATPIKTPLAIDKTQKKLNRNTLQQQETPLKIPFAKPITRVPQIESAKLQSMKNKKFHSDALTMSDDQINRIIYGPFVDDDIKLPEPEKNTFIDDEKLLTQIDEPIPDILPDLNLLTIDSVNIKKSFTSPIEHDDILPEMIDDISNVVYF